jgi:hypothetical protein
MLAKGLGISVAELVRPQRALPTACRVVNQFMLFQRPVRGATQTGAEKPQFGGDTRGLNPEASMSLVNLATAETKIHSQNGEDGVIEAIFDAIGVGRLDSVF